MKSVLVMCNTIAIPLVGPNQMYLFIVSANRNQKKETYNCVNEDMGDMLYGGHKIVLDHIGVTILRPTVRRP